MEKLKYLFWKWVAGYFVGLVVGIVYMISAAEVCKLP